MKTIRTNIPEQSLANNLSAINYKDCYKYTLNNMKDNTSPDDIHIKLWTEMPGWVNMLFELRNQLVKIVGLRGKDEMNLETFENAIRNGGEHPFMTISAKSDKETIIALKDKHLTAYLSLYMEDKDTISKDVYASTLVTFHKPLGNIYFYIIYPFHHLVVKNMLKYTLKKFEKEEKANEKPD